LLSSTARGGSGNVTSEPPMIVPDLQDPDTRGLYTGAEGLRAQYYLLAPDTQGGHGQLSGSVIRDGS
jgi:hypothetical protein